MTHFSTQAAQWLSQTEQVGGWWLIQTQLNQTDLLPVGTEIRHDDGKALLFSQNGKQAGFLAQSNLAFVNDKPNLTLHTPIQENDDTHPWRFLPLKPNLLTPGKPIVLFASDLNMASAFYLISQTKSQQSFMVILHASDSFPFVVKPARIMLDNFPPEAMGACPLLEDWHQLNRLCSTQGLPGCFDGDIKSLKQTWLPDNELTLWELK